MVFPEFKPHPEWKGMTQKERVKYWLENIGAITPLEGWEELGIHRIDRPIYLLRKEGMNIVNVEGTGRNKFGEKVTFARYELQTRSLEEVFRGDIVDDS